ncbi:hypothetical protein [Novosphingobium resinovorum]|uniref:Dyp-type peroxidase n=1 Tax=Novosphingobium resinovorum TaxID=158500 RepID=UPI002ED1560A|nr:hypothetical protein [Novosphingobium resinovorum]
MSAGQAQAILGSGFGSLGGARYVLMRVTEAAAARAWLRSLPVTGMADVRSGRLPRVCQLAFTASGMRALGLAVDTIPGFAPEFLDGLSGDPSRSRRLGDVGACAPEHWRWGSGDAEPHLLLILLADEAAIAGFLAETLGSMPPGAVEVMLANASGGPPGREPFGFVDGASQPQVDWEGTLQTGGAKDRLYRNRIAPGEFLLGHGNEYGFVADHPGEGIGRDGTYLVYRQLVQDVAGFWGWICAQAGPEGAIALAERMVGRGIDGAPLAGLGAQDGVGEGANDFTFAADPDGVACPIGAHVRRANPRSGDDPRGRRGFLGDLVSSLGLKGSAMHDAVASARFHRLLRRGRPYGAAPDPRAVVAGEVPPGECGLHFICLNASLARQFEFVQGSWIASPYFAGLSGEQDPLLGNRCPVHGGSASDAFAFHDAAGDPRLLAGLPRFVTVVGGGYFFLPALHGLARILRR